MLAFRRPWCPFIQTSHFHVLQVKVRYEIEFHSEFNRVQQFFRMSLVVRGFAVFQSRYGLNCSRSVFIPMPGQGPNAQINPFGSNKIPLNTFQFEFD